VTGIRRLSSHPWSCLLRPRWVLIWLAGAPFLNKTQATQRRFNSCPSQSSGIGTAEGQLESIKCGWLGRSITITLDGHGKMRTTCTGKQHYWDIKPRACFGCGHVFRSAGNRICKNCCERQGWQFFGIGGGVNGGVHSQSQLAGLRHNTSMGLSSQFAKVTMPCTSTRKLPKAT